MIRRRLGRIFLLCIFIQAGICSGQSGITGRIVGDNDSSIEHANVLLLRATDSSLVKGTFSQENGGFIFENIPGGSYLVTSTFTGFKQVWSALFSINDKQSIDLGKLIITVSSKELNAVTVLSKKPLYEHRPDRMIINVQNSITSAGNSALEILERSPGVVVNRQSGTIALNGKDGVTVMIDGKKSYMPAEAVVELLQGMNSGNIEKIELLTTPPSSLDAEGHAGYINIILKKNNNYGINGSYSATLGYGDGLVDEANFNFNYRKEKVNIYGNLSYTRVAKPLPIFLQSKYSNQGNIIESQFTVDRDETLRNMSARVGLDYQLASKTVVGALVSAYNSKYTHRETNENLILKNGQLDTLQKQANDEIKPWDNISINLNIQHDFRQGSRLSINADYIWYKNTQPYNYDASYYDAAGNFIYNIKKRSSKSTPINFWIGSADYSQKIGKNIILETGLKRTIARFSNDLGLERFIQGTWKTDSSYTAHHRLEEDYTAFYASANIDINKNTNARLGLRYEYTNYNLTEAGKITISERHYGKLFPVVSLTHKPDAGNTLNLSWSMRIARPTFSQLAPYTYFINENTFFAGNSALQPSISNTITAAWNNKKFLFTLSFTKEENPIWIFQPGFDTVAGKLTLIPHNFISQKLATAMISVPVNVNSWWTMQYNLTGSWQQVNADGDNPSKTDRMNINVNATESFRLPKNISIELSGFYQSSLLAGINKQKGYGSLDAGIKKKLPRNIGSLTLSAINILDTQDFIVNSDYPTKNQTTYLHINFVQRTLKLTFTHSFGNDRLKEKRERVTGADDAKGRVQ